MKRSATPDGKPNAFAVLMTSSQKKKKLQKIDSPGRASVVKSRFIECPAGCGRHFLEKDINAHLDRCVSTTFTVSSKEMPTTPIEETPTEAGGLPASHKMPSRDDSQLHNNEQINAFSHMMKKSATVFSPTEDTAWAQRFHLNANGSVSLTCYCTNPGQSQPENIEWSANSQIKAGKSKVDAIQNAKDGGDTFESKHVDLSLSSAISSEAGKIRLVYRHSKLSIPVLKSILQKAIRRRKSLPAVRVAMELADKSLGDLLRRLPIIMLEDSMLHPSLPLLTWLMAAHAKNFELGAFLLTKVLCAVYEMASCPWHDRLNKSESDSIKTTEAMDVTFDSFHKPGINHLLEDHDVYLWSMLLRARYGGMGCDVQMLDSYVKLWSSRFDDDGHLPESILKRFDNGGMPLRWSTLPVITHQSAARQSITRIETLVTQRLPVLEFADITTEGVDFHCSGVLDDAISDPWLFQQCITQIGAISTSVGLGPVPIGASEKRSWLERILKRCMWDYSSGVNRRLPLVEGMKVTGKDVQQDPLKTIWQSLILPKTKAFAENYVLSRLQKS
jgi:hypothetical protein